MSVKEPKGIKDFLAICKLILLVGMIVAML